MEKIRIQGFLRETRVIHVISDEITESKLIRATQGMNLDEIEISVRLINASDIEELIKFLNGSQICLGIYNGPSKKPRKL